VGYFTVQTVHLPVYHNICEPGVDPAVSTPHNAPVGAGPLGDALSSKQSVKRENKGKDAWDGLKRREKESEERGKEQTMKRVREPLMNVAKERQRT
jgi:hypothetical protein